MLPKFLLSISSLFLQVLLEAQDMAVRNHNVEYKSNLHIGTFASFFPAEKCHAT